LSMLLYLAAGCLGLPVFAGGASGFARLLGPTGGYLIGFIGQAAVAGLATHGRGEMLSWKRGIGFLLVSMVPAYVIGVVQLKFVMDLGWAKAGAVGALPFLPGDVIKTALAVAVYRMLRRRGALPAPPQSAR
ncbi:MAG: biotin transporter BioY, partial [Oceanidesulfovibrio sp.]